MERISSNDPEDQIRGDGVLEHLCRALQLLAAPAQAQLNHFPDWIVLTDEMALDLDLWATSVPTYWKLSQEQKTRLALLDDFLSKLSGPDHSEFWTNEALAQNPRWEAVRHLAQAALLAFCWPIEIPPSAQEEQGMLIDNGSYFIKNDPSSKHGQDT